VMSLPNNTLQRTGRSRCSPSGHSASLSSLTTAAKTVCEAYLLQRGDWLRHLRQHGCHLKREGRSHSLWINPATGAVEAVPQHTEIHDANSGAPRGRSNPC
jgi:mRNA interferase HicA